MRCGYCEIFVDGASPDALIVVAAKALGISWDSARASLLRYGEIEIEARRNPDRGPGAVDAPFLTWPSLIEIEASSDVVEDELVRVVGLLLTALWDANLRAVAAAEFEDQLPRRGGWHGGAFTEA